MLVDIQHLATVDLPSTRARAEQAGGGQQSNDAGDLIGTSDARGCGQNFHYDGAGRLIAEDYAP